MKADLVAFLHEQLQLLQDGIIMSSHQNLNTESLKLQQYIYNYSKQAGVEIRLWLVPEQYGPDWQRTVANQKLKET